MGTHFDIPLVITKTNIGPGCSSVGYGATQEIGPFLVDNKGNSLKFNPYAWNKGILYMSIDLLHSHQESYLYVK